MDIRITTQFLTDIGITLSDDDYAALADHIETTLHERVVTEVTELLEDDQLEALRQLGANDDDTMYTWLLDALPQLPDIVEDEVRILLAEIAENADGFQPANDIAHR